mgnify:CR=1 FL=1
MLNTQEEAYEKDKDVSKRILRSAKVLERMLNLNTFDEIAQDFRFSGIAVFTEFSCVQVLGRSVGRVQGH